MKGILKVNKKYILLFFSLICLPLLSACNGVTHSIPNINSFNASSISITEGDNVTLSWEITDATTIYLKQQSESGVVTETVALSGSTTVSPAETTTYTLTATSSYGADTDSITITVMLLHSYTVVPNESQMKDTFASSADPFTNFYGASYLTAGTLWGSGEIERIYLQFNLSTIPSNAVITEAKLGLFFTGSASYVSIPLYIEVPIAVYAIEDYWDETTLTWDNQPGVFYTYEDIQTLGRETYDYVYWNITNLVQEWISGTKLNYGIRLADKDEMTLDDIKVFSSSSATSGSERPKLTISYYIP